MTVIKTFTAHDPQTGKDCRIVVEAESVSNLSRRYFQILAAYGLVSGPAALAAGKSVTDCIADGDWFPAFIPGNVIVLDEAPGDIFDDPSDLWQVIAQYQTRMEA